MSSTLYKDTSQLMYTIAMGARVDGRMFMSLYNRVFEECIFDKQEEMYGTLCVALTNFYQSYKTMTFLPHVVFVETNLICQLYAVLKHRTGQNKHLSLYILQLAFKPNDDEVLYRAGNMAISAFSYLKRFWVSNNHEWVVWGPELIEQRFSMEPRSGNKRQRV